MMLYAHVPLNLVHGISKHHLIVVDYQALLPVTLTDFIGLAT